nr:MAG TPA: hypothetical protein [Caudoviricetes sp.]
MSKRITEPKRFVSPTKYYIIVLTLHLFRRFAYIFTTNHNIYTHLKGINSSVSTLRWSFFGCNTACQYRMFSFRHGDMQRWLRKVAVVYLHNLSDKRRNRDGGMFHIMKVNVGYAIEKRFPTIIWYKHICRILYLNF